MPLWYRLDVHKPIKTNRLNKLVILKWDEREKNRQSTVAKEYFKSSKHKHIINKDYAFQFKENICTFTFKQY